MEAIERNVGLLPLQPAVITSYNGLVAEARDALRPSEINLEPPRATPMTRPRPGS